MPRAGRVPGVKSGFLLDPGCMETRPRASHCMNMKGVVVLKCGCFYSFWQVLSRGNPVDLEASITSSLGHPIVYASNADFDSYSRSHQRCVTSLSDPTFLVVELATCPGCAAHAGSGGGVSWNAPSRSGVKGKVPRLKSSSVCQRNRHMGLKSRRP